jgi:zinc D-Ala-D-Ala carboxypeptidase
MKRMQPTAAAAVLAALAVTLLSGCATSATTLPRTEPVAAPHVTSPAPVTKAPETQQPAAPAAEQKPADKPQTAEPKRNVTVAANPNDYTVLINKSVMLPNPYTPADLVEPNVRFIFAEKHEKRFLRKDAARALEQMFAAAEQDGIYLAGVSGYRSYDTQKGLFNYYVQTQGEETARRYSAEPGHSEHQTGLAMDVSGSTGACAADDCFAGTPEAEWLASHAAAHGFIIRYPKGKEAVTGYAYEPWHLRYVGVELAAQIMSKGLTLEEFYAAKPA